jgi:hypothetical protein
MASTLGGISGWMLGQLPNPGLTDGVLNLLGERGRLFAPLLHNTVGPTILRLQLMLLDCASQRGCADAALAATPTTRTAIAGPSGEFVS